MLVRNQPSESRIRRLWSIAITCIAAMGVAGAAGFLSIRGTVGADPPDTTRSEQWGPQEGNLRTRLAPLADHFTLGQPMRLRLELKNVGQAVIHYDPQQVAINGSLAVHDPQGHPVRYIATSFQTVIGKRPALTPGNIAFLFDQLNLDSQYLIVKPGKYSMQFRGYGAPQSNTVEIDLRPGTLPPIKQIAGRLLDVLPNGWEITIHGYPGDSDHSRPVGWDEPPPGWEPVRGMPTIGLAGNRSRQGGVYATMWLCDRKLEWTGKVAWPGQTAAVHYGKCPEGYIYALLPSEAEAATAQWPTFKKDLRKALQAEREEPFAAAAETVKNDDDLKRLEGLTERDSLLLDNAEITDAGLKHLEGLTRLKTLWLRRTRVTDQGLQSLKKLPQLQNVWLDSDNITDAGLENLKGLTQLEGLSLAATKITDAGLEKLKDLTRLEYLSLRETPITDAGLETVEGFTRLRSLDLDGTRITDTGLQRIKGLTKIKRLSLANTRITDAGLEHLRGLTRLASLDLDETQVTDEGVGRLQQAFPRCEFFYKSAEERRRWWQAMEKADRKADRESSVVSRVQSIPRSSLKKHYIVQFNKPGLKRQPLLVIAWKAKDIPSIDLNHLNTDAPAITINGRLMTPSRTKKAVYALQPDYSLQQLSLTETEIARLFSHITRSEERAVSSSDVRILPSDPYWEEKVDPHLKVVEPNQKEKRS
ncbi:MAG: hypothetical protein K8R46_11890 [Pirellulales bacterium]|nr:hypothetical protein [Pirellulales bacterium]